MEVLAIIPARAGSKGISNKNIRSFAGKPLLSYSIQHALQSQLINRVIVSTDSDLYANISMQHGAEVPFLRPSNIATDKSTDFEVFEHALLWLRREENYIPDLCVHLRPTYPIRKDNDINSCIQILINNDSLDSVRSISEEECTPYKMWSRSTDGRINPVIKNDDIPESHSLPRQLLPKVYKQNACIDVVRTKTVLEKRSMTGDSVFGYLMNHNYDIDFNEDWEYAELNYKLFSSSSNKTYCFDIDGIIAEKVEDFEYNKAKPILENINAINKLYENGNNIILYTARGSLTGKDWEYVTRNQLNSWSVKYHSLNIGCKPAADFYIDDKFVKMGIIRNSIQSINE